jgi:protein-tyrosine phosphatase
MPQNGFTSHLNHWLATHYGSRRGFVLTWWHRLRYLLGGYRGYRQVDWKTVRRLVFVCKGNICRSAYAEACAHGQGVESISCGIQTVDGATANGEAVRAAGDNGMDLKEHRTRQLQSLELKKGDLLVAMEPWQAVYLESEYGGMYGCTLLGLWGSPAMPLIHDPYGATPAYFRYCFDYIESSVNEILEEIKKSERH